MLLGHHLKFYKSSLNSNSNITTYKEFFGCSRTGFSSVWWFVFQSSWPPLLWRGGNFLISNPFLMIVSVSIAPRGWVEVLFGLQKQQSPPLESGLPWAFKVFNHRLVHPINAGALSSWNISCFNSCWFKLCHKGAEPLCVVGGREALQEYRPAPCYCKKKIR